MSPQIWNAAGYAKSARFVTDLGAPVLDLLAPQSGEHILDVGCGDGVLTRKIADQGCRVVGLDASSDFVAAARRLGLEVVEADVTRMQFERRFDAVFSNAALHWVKDADAAIRCVARALKPGGRFVAEMGGHNCVNTVLSALIEELDRRGYDGQLANPWYFPTPEDYGARLAKTGFDVRHMALIPRPTPLPSISGWLSTFAGCFTSILPPPDREDFLRCVEARLKPQLCDAEGHWTADYVRLRFEAFLEV